MNWHQTLTNIYYKLKESGFPELSREIHDEQLKGSTGGEVLMLVLTKLMNIRESQPEAYKVIHNEAESLFEFAKSIGYL